MNIIMHVHLLHSAISEENRFDKNCQAAVRRWNQRSSTHMKNNI